MPSDVWMVGERPCPPGAETHVDLPVSRLPTGTWLSLPLKVVRGTSPGPTIWLSAGIHGDELNGVAIIRDVLDDLDPDTLSGAVIAVPVVNVFGLVNGSRYLPDRRDLNRSFPGSPRGSLAGRIAHLFMTEVVSRCQLGIDLHTGSGGRGNLPQIRGDIDDERTKTAALAFGAPVILHASIRDGSLRAAARKKGIPVLVYEGGEAGRFDSEVIRAGEEGVLQVMRSLGLLPRVPRQPRKKPMIARQSTWVRARRGGFCRAFVQCGDRVAPGQAVAEIFDTQSKKRVRVVSELGGVVVGLLQTALVNRGDAIVHVAQLE